MSEIRLHNTKNFNCHYSCSKKENTQFKLSSFRVCFHLPVIPRTKLSHVRFCFHLALFLTFQSWSFPVLETFPNSEAKRAALPTSKMLTLQISETFAFKIGNLCFQNRKSLLSKSEIFAFKIGNLCFQNRKNVSDIGNDQDLTVPWSTQEFFWSS
jgi:hypothetical protein